MQNQISPMPVNVHELNAMDVINGFEVRPGFYEWNGATAISNTGVNFTIQSNGATSCELLLFHRTEKDPFVSIPIPRHYRIGKVWSMIVFGLDIEEFEYAYRLDGPNNFKEGLLFDKNNILLDPYAKAVTGQSVWGVKNDFKNAYHARVVCNNFEWGGSRHLLTPVSDLIIYELHVRGFTQDISSGVKNRGTFDGLREKIPYLKDLGITAVELMPIFEFDECRELRNVNGKLLMDYWGYNTVGFFAPNTSYTANTEYNREGTELKEVIRDLHNAGIEVFLDVVFNHTAEGNENGPFISFKGFDNNIYYMLTPEGYYYNFSGCGNTLNCNHPMVQQMILECLRYWVTDYHVNGFRFDLATILGRNEDGSPMNNPPLLKQLAYDPILGDTKLIAEAWDAGGLYQVGSFPSWNRWAEWNGKYRDCMRSFLKGEYWQAPEAVQRVIGSPDLYGDHGLGNDASVNFLTCHDGFTLHDLYTYNEKHNEDNGWGGTDGTDDNRSWNCGIEGDTDQPEVVELRKRLIRNAVTVLMCSRGTPMFLAGDEFCNTQYGNNNPYCQDNIISWLDWNRLEEYQDIYAFFRYIIHFRLRHAAIRRNIGLSRIGYDPISVFNGGANPGEITSGTKAMGVLYAGYDQEKGEDDLVYLAMNVYWEDQTVSLPALPDKYYWSVSVDTGAKEGKQAFYEEEDAPETGKEYVLKARSVAVFTGKCKV